MYLICFLPQAHEEVVWLDVPVNEAARMHKLHPRQLQAAATAVHKKEHNTVSFNCLQIIDAQEATGRQLKGCYAVLSSAWSTANRCCCPLSDQLMGCLGLQLLLLQLSVLYTLLLPSSISMVTAAAAPCHNQLLLLIAVYCRPIFLLKDCLSALCTGSAASTAQQKLST
jgi:hypothetical protein